MDRNRIVGAIRFPAFLMFWSLGLLLIVGKFDSADASSARTAILVKSPLTKPVGVDDSDALSREMSRAFRRSEVFSGEWLPDDDRERVAPAPVPAPVTEKVAVEPAGRIALVEHEEPMPRQAPDETPDESVGMQDSMDADGPATRVVHITSVSEISAETEDKDGSQARDGFSKTPSLSIVRKTRPSVHPMLAALKQDARREIERGRIHEAFRGLRASVEQGRNDPEYLGLLAISALRSGNAAEASVVYERLLEMQPESERWWAGLALAREQQGMDATPVFQRMLALSEENTALKRLVRQKIGTFG